MYCNFLQCTKCTAQGINRNEGNTSKSLLFFCKGMCKVFSITLDHANFFTCQYTHRGIVHYVHFIFVKYTVPIFTHTWRFKWTASWVFFYLTNFWVKPLDIALIMNIKKKDYYNGFSSFGLFGAFYRVKCSRKQKYSTRCQYNFNF